ncbi:ATP-dependent 6-phosphofructokinase 6-like protein [Tanacetum coccineum]
MAKFKGLGGTLEDKVLVRKLLNSVPKKFFPIVATIEQYQDLDEMSFEEAIGRLTAFEERIKSQDTLEANDQDKLLMASSNNKSYGKWRETAFLQVYFAPDEVHAAIVTCGGLCPGLNTVIREIVCDFYHMYGVTKVLGIDGGYRGFYSKNTITLTPKFVNDIHKRGGTIIGTSRGGHDKPKIVESIQDRGINQHLDGHIEEVKGMLTDCGDDMHCQFLEILRSLLDSFSQIVHGTVSESNSSVDYLIERNDRFKFHLGSIVSIKVYRRVKPDQATRCIEKDNERWRTHVTEDKWIAEVKDCISRTCSRSKLIEYAEEVSPLCTKIFRFEFIYEM